jgi:outer membrane biosynthesis protein TonB
MTSGYLWRGAVEVRKSTEVLRSTAPAIAFELSDAPFGWLGHLRVRVPRASSPVEKRRAVVRATPGQSSPARRSGAAQLIAAVETPPTSPARGRAKHRSPARGAQPAPKPPASPVPPPPPPPVSSPEPTPPPPAGVETGPGRGKKEEKKEKKQKPEKQAKPEKQPKAEKKTKDEKGDKGQKCDRDEKGQGKGKGKK